MKEWAKIKVIDDRQYLFVNDYDSDDEQAEIKVTVNVSDLFEGVGMISLSAKRDDNYTQEEFNSYVENFKCDEFLQAINKQMGEGK